MESQNPLMDFTFSDLERPNSRLLHLKVKHLYLIMECIWDVLLLKPLDSPAALLDLTSTGVER